MIKTNRTRRATLKQRATLNRATQRARRNVATGKPQTARTHLTAAGIDDTTAKRFAGAFSRGIIADQITTTRIKLKGRTRKTVQAKLYTLTTFANRLTTYRPKDKNAANLFARAAHTLAA
jgi:hypothetical protein